MKPFSQQKFANITCVVNECACSVNQLTQFMMVTETCLRMVCMMLISTKVLCVRPQDSFFRVIPWGDYCFPYMPQLLASQNDRIEPTALDARVHGPLTTAQPERNLVDF